MSKVGKIGKIGKARDYLTSGEVAQKLGMPRRTVTYLGKKGVLPRLPSFGGHYRYPPKEIEDIAKSKTLPVPGENKDILLLKDAVRRLRQGLAQREAYDILEGKWVEVDYTPPPEI